MVMGQHSLDFLGKLVSWAERIVKRAQRRAVKRSLFRFQEWTVDSPKQGQVFRSLRADPVPHDEFLHQGARLFNPVD
eukprot:2320146-Pyramimonas_sp.AAC.1